jgi:hypothetical protein
MQAVTPVTCNGASIPNRNFLTESDANFRPRKLQTHPWRASDVFVTSPPYLKMLWFKHKRIATYRKKDNSLDYVPGVFPHSEPHTHPLESGMNEMRSIP